MASSYYFDDAEEFYDRQKSLYDQLRALAPQEEEGPGFFEGYIRRPVGQLFGRTQSLLTEPLLGGTEGYQQAAQELQQMTGRPEGDWEALPGLGDVLATQLPEGARHGVFIEPVTRFAGNVVGDPTNWTPAILGKASMKLAGPAIQAGRLAKAHEAGAAIDEAVRGGMALEDALKVPAAVAADSLEAALKGGNPAERYRAAKTLIEASGDANAAQTYTRLAGLGLGTDAAMMGAAGVAFAPDIAKASGQAFQQAWDKFQEGELGQAAAAGTTGVLMAGLGGLMAKGMIDAGRAGNVLYEHLSKTDPGAAAKLAQNASEKAAADFDEWFPGQPGWKERPPVDPLAPNPWEPPNSIPNPWEIPSRNEPIPAVAEPTPVPEAPVASAEPAPQAPVPEPPPAEPPVVEPPVEPPVEEPVVAAPEEVVPPPPEAGPVPEFEPDPLGLKFGVTVEKFDPKDPANFPAVQARLQKVADIVNAEREKRGEPPLAIHELDRSDINDKTVPDVDERRVLHPALGGYKNWWKEEQARLAKEDASRELGFTGEPVSAEPVPVEPTTPPRLLKRSERAQLRIDEAKRDIERINAEIKATIEANKQAAEGTTRKGERGSVPVGDFAVFARQLEDLALAHMRLGGYTFEKFAARVAEQFPEVWAAIRDSLEGIWNRAKQRFQPSYGQKAPKGFLAAEGVELQDYHKAALEEFTANKMGGAPREVVDKETGDVVPMGVTYRDLKPERKDTLQQTISEVMVSPEFAATPNKEEALRYLGGAVRQAKRGEYRKGVRQSKREVMADAVLEKVRREDADVNDALDTVVADSITGGGREPTPEEALQIAEERVRVKDILDQREAELDSLEREVTQTVAPKGPNDDQALLDLAKGAFEGDPGDEALLVFLRDSVDEETGLPAKFTFPEGIRQRDAAAARLALYNHVLRKHGGKELSNEAIGRLMAEEVQARGGAYVAGGSKFSEFAVSRIRKAYAKLLEENGLIGGMKRTPLDAETQQANRILARKAKYQAGLREAEGLTIGSRPARVGEARLDTEYWGKNKKGELVPPVRRTPRELVNERQFGPQQPGVEPRAVEGKPVKVTVSVAQGRPPATRGVGDKAVGQTFRVQGDNGTWLEISRGDTPSPAGPGIARAFGGTIEGEATPMTYRWRPVAATHLNLGTVGSLKGDHTPESIAGVLRTLLSENQLVDTLSVTLRPGEGGVRWAVSPMVEKALRQLETEGLISRRGVGVAEIAEGKPALLDTGGRRVPVSVPTGEGRKAGRQLLTEVDELRNRARKLRAHADEAERQGGMPGSEVEKIRKSATRFDQEAELRYNEYVQNQKAGKEAYVSRVEQEIQKEVAAAREWTGEAKPGRVLVRAGREKHWAYEGPSGERQRKPVSRIYDVGGVERKVANMATVADEELSPAQLRLRRAHDLDAIDAAVTAGRVSVPNVDGVHGEDFLQRVAQAHGRMFPALERVAEEISTKLGLGARLKGVVASPFRAGMVVGEDLRGGQVYLNPLQALYEAKAARQGYQEAARRTVFTQLLHELSHAYDNATLHGEGFDTRVQDLVKRASEVQADVDRWIAQIADEANWRELEALHDEYRKLVEDATGGRIREGWRGAEEGVGGVRPGAAEGRAAPLPDRPAQAAYGAEAGRGVGVRPGAAVPEGAGGAAGAVGEAPAGRPGGERVGAGGRAAGAGGDQEDRRRVAAFFRRPGNIEEARKAIDAFHNIKGRPDELMADATHLASEWMRLLREAKNGGNQAAADEWARRLKSRPDPKQGEMHSRINNVMTDLDEDTKVTIQMWSEITRAHPELRKSFDADQPMNFYDIPDEARAILDVTSPVELEEKWKKGLRLSYAETHALRIIGNDVMYNINELEARHNDALIQASMLTGADQARFIAEKVEPIRTELQRQNNRLFLTMATINEGTEWGRKGAIRRLKIIASDPQMQDFYQMREGVREMVGARFKNKAERDKIVDQLMAEYRAKRFQPDWSTKGAQDWYRMYQQMMKFTTVDKALQFFKAGLLGWPSRFANITSNSGFVLGLRKLEDALATAMEHGLAKVQGRAPERYVQELPLQMAAMRRAMHGGIGEWTKENKNALLMRPLEFGRAASQDMRHELVQMPSAIGGRWGEFVSYHFKGMNADDALFKHMIKVDQWYKQVYRRVRDGVRGFDQRPGETAVTATERLVDELETNLKSFYNTQTRLDKRFTDIIESAHKVAARDTFQEELPGWAKGIQQSFYRGGGRAFQIPVPFFKTPFNIAREVLKRTPLGLIGDLPKALRKGGMTRAQRMDLASRHLVSAAIGAGIFAMMDPEVLSGSGPMDPEANALKQRTGWRPYSIKIGGEWRSYQRLEPISSLLGMVADAREGLEQGDFDRYETGMARVLGSIAENITNKTFLSGLENLNQAMSDPIRYANEWVKRTQASMMPNSIGFVPVGHLATQLDPVYRETEAFTTSPWVAKVPGLSKTLRPQYSPTGEIRERPGTFGPRVLSPIISSPERTDPVAQAARMLSDINFPMRRVRPVLDYKGVKVKLDPEEQQDLAKAQEEAMKFIGTRLMKDPNFRRLPDNEEMADYPGQRTKKDVIARIVRRYRNPVMAKLRPVMQQRAARYLRDERRLDAGGA